MFATYSQYKLPFRIQGDPSTLWTGVELVLNVPFFLCTVDVDGVPQRFLHTLEEEVVRMAGKTTEERLVGVHLVVPPESSEDGTWSVLPVLRISKQRQVREGEPSPSLVLTTQGGATYAGYPLERTDPVNHEGLDLVADFELRASART